MRGIFVHSGIGIGGRVAARMAVFVAVLVSCVPAMAQDTQEQEFPLPKPKTAIATEKPVKIMPGDPVPDPSKPQKIPAQETLSATETEQSPAADTPTENVAKTADTAETPAPAPQAETQTIETSTGTVTIGAPPVTAPPVQGTAAAATAAAEGATAAAQTDSLTTQQQQAARPQVPVDSTATAVQAPQQQRQPTPQTPAPQPRTVKKSTNLTEELSLLNVPVANLKTVKFVIDDEFNLRGMVYGEELGYFRILEADNDGNFKQVWKSPPHNSPIREIFALDLDGDNDAEIVLYTAEGNLFIYDYNTHDLVYRTPEGMYQNINCMAIENMDDDPQLELFYIAVKPGTGGGSGSSAGNLVQFDPLSQFEEWTSADLYSATDMMIGNVDTDPEPEIVLNTGQILGLKFKDVEWTSTVNLGSRLYLIDMDGDGMLELVTEYGESYIKVIDVDRREEKW